MLFSWFSLIVLLGIMQGIVSCVILIFQDIKSAQKAFFVTIILVLCCLSFKIEIHVLGLWNQPLFRYFPLGIDLLLPALLFLYVCSITKSNFVFKPQYLIHFLLPLLFFIHSVIVYLSVFKVNDLVQKDFIAQNWYFNQIKSIEDVLAVISAFVYGYLSVTYIRKYQHWLYQQTSDTRYPTLNWLRNLLIVTAILGLGLFFNVLIDNTLEWNTSFYRWQIFYLYLTFLIYYLSIKVFAFKTEIILVEQLKIEERVDKHIKYDRVELQAVEPLIIVLLKEKKIFLDNELTLQKLSQQLKLSPNLVSATINQLFGKTFRSVINEYRIAEVKVKLLDPAYKHLSLLGIALECGFSSEASFYRIFKQEVGCSPRDFISSQDHI